MRNFKDLLENWTNHVNTAYHKENVMLASSFKETKSTGTVIENWNRELKKESNEWRCCIRGIARGKKKLKKIFRR